MTNTAEVIKFPGANAGDRSNRMENQKTGFIPLYRSVLKKPWSKDVFLRTLWENLLFAAAHQPYTANFKGQYWPLQTGQLVTTPADLGLNLRDRNGKPASRDAVDRMLSVFEREGMISRAGERRKGTVITIVNYAVYAQKTDNLPAQLSAHISAINAAHSDASNGAVCDGDAAHISAVNAAQLPAHHEQQLITTIKNKISSSGNSDESPNEATVKFLSRHPEAADGIYTPCGKSWGTADDLKAARWIFTQLLVVNASLSEPKWTEWANTIRLMRVQDGRSHRDICELLLWASKDDFWKDNILSPSSLRRQWDKLTTRRLGGTPGKQTTSATLDFNNTDWAEGIL